MIDIEVRPLLSCGGIGTGPNGPFIFLCDNLNREEATKTLWHEFRHLMASNKPNGGTDDDHDEDKIDADAERLAKAFPEIIEWCGLENKYPKPVDKV
jgi:hypothetical protein